MKWERAAPMLLVFAATSLLAADYRVYSQLNQRPILSTNLSTGRSSFVALASSIATNIFPSRDGTRLFVVNSVPVPTYGGSVTAIDIATGRTIATYHPIHILMGQVLWFAPAFAFSADGSKFFVASCQVAGCTSLSSNGYVEEFDIASTKEVGSLAVPGNVSEIMASPDGKALYIIHPSTGGRYLELTAVALPSLVAGRSIPLALPNFAFSSTIGVISPSGSTLYVASPIRLSALNLPDLTLRNSVPLSLATEAIAISANGSQLGLLQTNFPNAFNEQPGIVSFADPTTLAISSVQISWAPLSALAMDPAGTFAYAAPALGDGNSVSMLDQVSAQTLSATMSKPVDGLLDLALPASGQPLYMLLGSGATLAAFNSPNPIPTSITLSSEFQGLSISPDGETLFASPRNFNGLLVKSASTGATIAQYLPTSRVYTTAVSPDGKVVFAAAASNTIDVLDASNGAILQSFNNIYTGSSYPSFVLSADGTTILASENAGTGPVVIMKIANDRVVSTSQLPNAPLAYPLAISPTAQFALLANGGQTSAFDLTSNAITGNFAPASFAAISPTAPLAYLCCTYSTSSQSYEISAVDTNTNAVIATLPAGSYMSLAFTPDGRYLYAVPYPNLPLQSSGFIIDTTTQKIVSAFPGFGVLAIH